MGINLTPKEVLDYHERLPIGKLETVPTKPLKTLKDLSSAYTPGVAFVCEEIARDSDKVFSYTNRGNLVAVISNGTAVLGLGDIGPEAAKPVMEAKAMMFKRMAGINSYDIVLNAKDPKLVIEIVKAMAPTFGGINLEDIKAPECFEIEEQLKTFLNIPVVHDDQHATAIVSAAALVNALELVNKDISKVKIVVNGAGAAAIATASLLISLGAKKENLVMCDTKGAINCNRKDVNNYKAMFMTNRNVNNLTEALQDADVFIGLSVANLLNAKHLQSMASNPILFTMANPVPEISYEDAIGARKDIIVASGRTNYPNQINNVLCYPFLFRGALDVRATTINENMKLAAVKALADLAKEPVPEAISKAYGNAYLQYGRDYLLPKVIDHRLIFSIPVAVAEAAMESEVAKLPIKDWDVYKRYLKGIVSPFYENM